MSSDTLGTCKFCSCSGFSGKVKGIPNETKRCRACRHTALDHRWAKSSAEVPSSPQPASPIEDLTVRRRRRKEFKIFEDPPEEQAQAVIAKGKQPAAPPEEDKEGKEDKEDKGGEGLDEENNAPLHPQVPAAPQGRVTLAKIMEHLITRSDYADALKEAEDAQKKAADEILASRIGELRGQMEALGNEVRGLKDVVVGVVNTLDRIVGGIENTTSKRSTRSVGTGGGPVMGGPDSAAEDDTQSESSAAPSISLPLRRGMTTDEEYRFFNTSDLSSSSSGDSLPPTSDEAAYLPEIISPPAPFIEIDEGDTTGDELDVERDPVAAPSQEAATPETPDTSRETSDEEPEDSPTTPVLQLHSGLLRVPLSTIKEESSGERTEVYRDLRAVKPIVPALPFRPSPRSPREPTFYGEERFTTSPARITSPAPKTPTFVSRIPTPRKRPANDTPSGANTVHKRVKNAPTPKKAVEFRTARGKVTSSAPEAGQIATRPTPPVPESPAAPASGIPTPRKRRAHDVQEGSNIARKRVKGTPAPEDAMEVKTASSKLTSSAPPATQMAAKSPVKSTGKSVTKAAPHKLSLPAPQARHTAAKPPTKPDRPPPAKGRQVPPAKAPKVPPPPPPRPRTRRSVRGRPNGHINPTEIDELQQ